jgi:hypothetical protein
MRIDQTVPAHASTPVQYFIHRGDVMRSSNNTTVASLLLPVLMLAGCGGGGGDDDSPSQQLGTDPFSIDSYREYSEGTDLSGIWMMVVHAQFDYQTDDGQIKEGNTTARTTLFLMEDSEASSGMRISNLFCNYVTASQSVEFSGSTLTVSSSGLTFNLEVKSNSRITGEIEPPAMVHCEQSDDCMLPISNMSSTAELIKVAPLPEPRGFYYFGANRPTLGNVTADVPSTGFLGDIKIGFEPVSCLSQIVARGQRIIDPYPFTRADNDYENIIINHGERSLLVAEKSDLGVRIENANFAAVPTPDMLRAGDFDYGAIATAGANPSTVTVDVDSSSDASSDASSDGAEIEINLDI